MKNDPLKIIIKVLSGYMSNEVYSKIIEELSKQNNIGPNKLKSIVAKYFEWETILYKPLRPQDVWIYNYLFIECKNTLRRDGLIRKYERDVYIPNLLSKI